MKPPSLRTLLSVSAALLSVMCLASPAGATVTISGGNIINQTWSAALGPYVINGDITVPAGSTLTIEAGTEVVFGA